MGIEITPFQATHEAAARRFNQRLRAGGETEFFLEERAPKPAPREAAVRPEDFVSLENEEIRGAFLLVHYPGQVGGAPRPLVNIRAPLSEGSVDPKYMMVALRQLRWALKRNDHCFALGMGGEDARYSQLLKSAGWRISSTPFFFKILKAGAFLKNAAPLKTSPLRRVASTAARLSGAGALGVAALNARGAGASRAARSLTIEQITRWGDWADPLWEAFAARCSVAAARDARTLASLYPLGEDARLRAFRIREGERTVGWSATLDRRMSGHKFFGDMHVATLLDAVVEPDAMAATVALTERVMRARGADLIVTNQSHRDWTGAFARAGYLCTRSNYVLALSPALTQAIEAQPDGLERMHFTRGDSDGRINL